YWYKKTYSLNQLLFRSLVKHYLTIGWKKKFDPSPLFCSEKYLDDNPDVIEAVINPLLHYETHGRREGRKVFCSSNLLAPPPLCFKNKFSKKPSTISKYTVKKPKMEIISYLGHELGNIDKSSPNLKCSAESLYAFLKINQLDTSHLHINDFDLDAEPLTLSDKNIFCCKSISFINEMTMRCMSSLDYNTPANNSRILSFYQININVQKDNVIEKICEQVINKTLQCYDVKLLNQYMPILICETDLANNISQIRLIPFPSLYLNGIHFSEAIVHEDLKGIQLSLLSRWLEIFSSGQYEWLHQININLNSMLGSEKILSTCFIQWLYVNMGIVIKYNNLSIENAFNKTLSCSYDRKTHIHYPNSVYKKELPIIASNITIADNSIPLISSLLDLKSNSDEYSAVSLSIIYSNLTTLHPKFSISIPISDNCIYNNHTKHIVQSFQKDSENIPSGSNQAPHLELNLIKFVDNRNILNHSSQLFLPISNDLEQKQPLIQPSATTNLLVLVKLTSCNFKHLCTTLYSISNQYLLNRFNPKILIIGKEEQTQRILSNVAQFKKIDQICPGVTIKVTHFNRLEFEISNSHHYKYICCISEGVVLHDPRTLTTMTNISINNGSASIGCSVLQELILKKKNLVTCTSNTFILERNPHQDNEWKLSNDLPDELLDKSTYPVLSLDSRFFIANIEKLLKSKINLQAFVEEELDENIHSFIGLNDLNLHTTLVSVSHCEIITSKKSPVKLNIPSQYLLNDLLNRAIAIEGYLY
ncbi:hypothetical protein OAO18_09200, partial [Francisellaceae bacterium]|nr:hypothetical protein [Francisellaceae bacterium]